MRLLPLVLVASCGVRTVYTDPYTGYEVRYNQRYHRGVGLGEFGIIALDGDRGEPGYVQPAVLEYIFASPESPFTRYYEIVLPLEDKPRSVVNDLKMLEQIARQTIPPPTPLRATDYARALAQKIARPFNEAMAIPGSRFEGSVGVYWGIPVDLDAGIPLLPYEYDGEKTTYTTIIRHARANMIVMYSSATRSMFAWDVSKVPGAFDRNAVLDVPTVAATIVAMHPTR